MMIIYVLTIPDSSYIFIHLSSAVILWLYFLLLNLVSICLLEVNNHFLISRFIEQDLLKKWKRIDTEQIMWFQLIVKKANHSPNQNGTLYFYENPPRPNFPFSLSLFPTCFICFLKFTLFVACEYIAAQWDNYLASSGL